MQLSRNGAGLVAIASLTACGDPAPDVQKARADIVVGAGSSSATPSPSSGATGGLPATGPKKARTVCTTPPKADGKKLADVALGHVEAEGETALDGPLVTGGGKWTWVNLWAGWCGPCKEEMPMFKTWEAQLGGALRFEFLSVDDDERLAVRFLNAQPKDGVRASRHAAKLEDRKKWLESAGLDSIEVLPIHVLVDKKGLIRCVIKGAVDAADFPRIEALVKRND